MRIRVLLALADDETRAFYASNLEAAGFRVFSLPPSEAVASALEVGAQVVVLDAAGPGDRERCAAFKHDARVTKVPVIALAGPDAAGILQSACDIVLPIECLPDVLVRAIDRLFRSHPRVPRNSN